MVRLDYGRLAIFLRAAQSTTGNNIAYSSALIGRDTAPKSDVLHSTYVNLSAEDVRSALVMIQNELCSMMSEQKEVAVDHQLGRSNHGAKKCDEVTIV